MKKHLLIFLLIYSSIYSQTEIDTNKVVTSSRYIDVTKLPEEILKKYSIRKDKFTSTTFLIHKKSSENLRVYISLNNSSAFLRFVCKYEGQDWVFMKNIVFLIDGIRYDYTPKNIKRNAYLGGVYERVDDLIIDSSSPLLNALCNAKSGVDIRFEGDTVRDFGYYRRVTISIKETIDLFKSFSK